MEVALPSPSVLEDALAGDAAAFGLVLQPLWDPAYRLAFSMLRDRGAAEDAVQEAALKAWRNVRKLRRDTSELRPWFLTIVANQCRSMRRSRWWGVERHENPETPTESDSARLDESLDLVRALYRLSPNHRLVLALRFYLDLPMDEVATVLGMPLSSAKSRLRRALRALEPVLNYEGDHS